MGERKHAPTLTRAGRHLRLTVTGDKVLAQYYDADPEQGGRYLGMFSHPAKTLAQVVDYYEALGWTGVEQDPGETPAAADA